MNEKQEKSILPDEPHSDQSNLVGIQFKESHHNSTDCSMMHNEENQDEPRNRFRR